MLRAREPSRAFKWTRCVVGGRHTWLLTQVLVVIPRWGVLIILILVVSAELTGVIVPLACLEEVILFSLPTPLLILFISIVTVSRAVVLAGTRIPIIPWVIFIVTIVSKANERLVFLDYLPINEALWVVFAIPEVHHVAFWASTGVLEVVAGIVVVLVVLELSSMPSFAKTRGINIVK